MDINILETFRKVALLQSISKAADEMYLSVSTVTGRIKALEDSLKVELFHRSGRRFELSDEGKHFLNYVERFISILEEGQQKIKLTREGQTGELGIAFDPVVGSYLLPDFISRFQNQHPGIELRLITCSYYEVIEKVSSGQVELGIMNIIPDDHGLITHKWFDDEWVMVSPIQTMQTRSEYAPSDLVDLPILSYEIDQRPWSAIMEWYKSGGVQPSTIMELAHIETIKQLMIEFQALSFLPKMSVAHEINEGVFTAIPLSPRIPISSEVAFFYRPNEQVSAMTAALIEFASQYDGMF